MSDKNKMTPCKIEVNKEKCCGSTLEFPSSQGIQTIQADIILVEEGCQSSERTNIFPLFSPFAGANLEF